MSKRMVAAHKLVEPRKVYKIPEAVEVLKQAPAPKFDETVELALSFDVDPKQSDQNVRGTVVLPHGTGKTLRVLVFAKGEQERQAREAGADHVGAEELIAKVEGGWMDFDAIVATPDLMREVGKLGRILGPRGLMPSPKAGTVTVDVGRAVREVKGGKVEFKMDKQGDIHLGVGKRSFPTEHLVENLNTLLDAVWKAKPAAAKGKYLRSVVVSTTMGPGLKLDTGERKSA
ncbi:MAG: 50S ribosomal protein L1 [Candidatus Omnitrophica bacterium]|nr:50S ribosomal protein L1 [Candidatus Omnitrophota bacterium]